MPAGGQTPDRELGSIEARLRVLERESERQRGRLHDLESSSAAVAHLTAAFTSLREEISDLPVTEERVMVLAAEMRNVKRALWSFTFAIVGGAVTFAFIAIQLISQ